MPTGQQASSLQCVTQIYQSLACSCKKVGVQPLPPDADLLVLGTGRRAKQLAPELARQLHEMGVRVDAMDTVSSPMHMAVDSVEASRAPGLAPLLACLAKLHTEGRWRQRGAVEQPHSMNITTGFEPWARRLMRWRHLMSSTRRREAWWVRSSLKMLRTDGEQEERAREEEEV